MNKTDFFDFISGECDFDDVNKEVAFLSKVKDIWIPQLIAKKTKNYTKCQNCERYILNSDYITESKHETNRGECIFQDAGYGEDDEYADVTYLIRYKICPKCRHREVISKTHLETTNVRTKYGYKY